MLGLGALHHLQWSMWPKGLNAFCILLLMPEILIPFLIIYSPRWPWVWFNRLMLPLYDVYQCQCLGPLVYVWQREGIGTPWILPPKVKILNFKIRLNKMIFLNIFLKTVCLVLSQAKRSLNSWNDGGKCGFIPVAPVSVFGKLFVSLSCQVQHQSCVSFSFLRLRCVQCSGSWHARRVWNEQNPEPLEVRIITCNIKQLKNCTVHKIIKHTHTNNNRGYFLV